MFHYSTSIPKRVACAPIPSESRQGLDELSIIAEIY
jgi:hypothetical protein